MYERVNASGRKNVYRLIYLLLFVTFHFVRPYRVLTLEAHTLGPASLHALFVREYFLS